MKVGDLVSYYDCDDLAIVLYVNEESSTVKVLLFSGKIGWLVMSGCKVV
jgi:hypothetical protein|tara:strand:+ start:498 stop:644 length:147 start_codon:yes stop_codon:yes gene_type:complete